ncbi:MAG: hypothetical protein HY887_06850 [Deltaproteobacteria bacterium]|nr:hypothetical protein [Deltaproteobacteria bacterium]
MVEFDANSIAINLYFDFSSGQRDYGLVEVQSIYTKMDSKAYLAAGTAAVDFIAAEITAKAHIIATISTKEEV